MFKTRENKTFSFQSSFSKKRKIDAGLDESEESEFISKWKNNRAGSRNIKGGMPLRMLIIVLVLLLICMYILDSKFK